LKFETLEEEIEYILEYNHEARADDMTLYSDYVYRRIKDEGLGLGWLVKIFSDRKYRASKGICTFETVTRVRRRLQASNPELRPTKEAIEARKEQTKKIKQYARGEIC
jgi:hypothetical protein